MKKYKICLYTAFILSICLGIITFEMLFYRQIPDVIYVKKGEKEEINFALPVTSEIREKEDVVETFGNGQKKLSTADTLTEEDSGMYTWNIKLFGVVPLKEIRLEVVEEQ